MIANRYIKKLFFIAVFSLFGNVVEAEEDIITFATCADYPPFEYYDEKNNLIGFDVELAQLVAAKLHKKAVFKDMSFGSIVVSVQTEIVDAGISAMDMTEEKKKRFDFSKGYHRSAVSFVCKSDRPNDVSKIGSCRVACQLGCTGHEKIIKQRAPDAEIIFFDKMNVAVEALKTEKIEYVFLDDTPATEFCKKNKGLQKLFVQHDDEEYGILLKKGSPLKAPIDRALDELIAEGKLEELKNKYLGA